MTFWRCFMWRRDAPVKTYKAGMRTATFTVFLKWKLGKRSSTYHFLFSTACQYIEYGSPAETFCCEYKCPAKFLMYKNICPGFVIRLGTFSPNLKTVTMNPPWSPPSFLVCALCVLGAWKGILLWRWLHVWVVLCIAGLNAAMCFFLPRCSGLVQPSGNHTNNNSYHYWTHRHFFSPKIHN